MCVFLIFLLCLLFFSLFLGIVQGLIADLEKKIQQSEGVYRQQAEDSAEAKRQLEAELVQKESLLNGMQAELKVDPSK